jgi:hypothetical protein
MAINTIIRVVPDAGIHKDNPMARSAGIGLTLQNRQFQKYGFLLNSSIVPVLWQLSQNIEI